MGLVLEVVLAIALVIVKQVVLVNAVQHVEVLVAIHVLVIAAICVAENAMEHAQNNAVTGVLAVKTHAKKVAVVGVHKDAQMDANCLVRTIV